MGAHFYTAPPAGLRIPNLERLKNEGSFAEGVEGVYPSVTYPAHTTLVTGRLPAEHGIYSNLSSRQAGQNPNDWYWFSKAIKVPTLWEEARRAGLSTASVSWPVTAGAGIDWNVPEIWDTQKGEFGDPLYVAKFMNPLLTLEIATSIGAPEPGTDDDTSRARTALFLLTRHKPDLFLLHLGLLDEAEHQHGPESREAARALERLDQRVGEFLAALKQAGLESSTDVFIVSDHGFLPIERVIYPNLLLVKAGLLTADAYGRVAGGRVATVSNGGSFFIYWPEGPEGQALGREVEAALKPLLDRGILWAVFDQQALKDLGADPGARMALEAPAGAVFGDHATGELVTAMKSAGGTHGYLPYRAGLEAAFIAWGPRIKPAVNLHRIRMTAIGPTMLEDLGIHDPEFGAERPLTDIFR